MSRFLVIASLAALWFSIFFPASGLHAGVVAALVIATDSQVELMVADDRGLRLGRSDGGSNVFEIPNGSYFHDSAIANDGDTSTKREHGVRRTIYLDAPQCGQYNLTLIGMGLGSYDAEIRLSTSIGGARTLRISGVTNSGTRSQYAINCSVSPETWLRVRRLVTLETTRADIDNSVLLGLISDPRIAASLSTKVMEMLAVNGPKRAKTLSNFRHELQAEVGRHITELAAAILLADADSLAKGIR